MIENLPAMTHLRLWFTSDILSIPFIVSFLTINALFSLLVVVLLQFAQKKRTHRHHWFDIITLTFFGTLLPVAGPLLLVVIMMVLPFLKKEFSDDPQPQLLKAMVFEGEIRIQPATLGAGGALAILQNAPAHHDQRTTHALLAIEKRRNQRSTQLITEALIHEDESTRLLAHHLLERREKSILVYMSSLKKNQPARHLAHLPPSALELAELHLEFIYLGLVSGTLRKMHIDQARTAIERITPPDTELPWMARYWVIRARIMSFGDMNPEAIRQIDAAYRLAMRYNAAPARTLPWFLERAWKHRNYHQLKKWVTTQCVFSDLPGIGLIVQRWNQNDGA